MKKSKRMESIEDIMRNKETKAIKTMQQSQKNLVIAKQQLESLHKYLEEYRIQFQQLTTAGASIQTLQDYQSFMSRLSQAIKEQQHLVTQKEQQQQLDIDNWQDKRKRTNVINHVVKHFKRQENRQELSSAQKLLDEANCRRFHLPTLN